MNAELPNLNTEHNDIFFGELKLTDAHASTWPAWRKGRDRVLKVAGGGQEGKWGESQVPSR